MSKSNKQRAGLQKKVSSVFKGVSIPGAKHAAEPGRMPTPDSHAASAKTKPDGNRPKSCREMDKAPQPEAVAGRTDQQSSAVVKPSISTGSTKVERSQSRSVEKPVPSKESQSPLALESTVMYSPDISKEPKTVQEPATEKSDPVDERTDERTAKQTADPAPRVSKSRPAEPSSLMRKLEQAEESAPPASTHQQKAPISLAKRLAQSEEAAEDSPSALTTTTAASKVASRQDSRGPGPMDGRQPQASPAANAPAKHSLADQLADAGDEGGFLQQIKEKLMPSGGGSAKDKAMVILVPILAIVMVFMFRQVLHKSPGKAKGTEKKDKKVAVVEPSEEIEWTIPEPLPAMTRNPLKLPEPDEPENPGQTDAENPDRGTTTDQAQVRNLQVRDIVYSQDKATALVGNQIVRAGSRINGVTIVRINRDSVELEKNGETWVQKVRD